LDLLLRRLRVEFVPVTAAHAEIARSAFRDFGKGRHPAALNFGDCFSYALSRALNEPLLFVGDDFPRTDVVVAAY
ncbi:MAG: type II toxin-antitoxin system VapC family toxin, partial [Gemmatimonadota bacterium]|nr:type II toxin-antitoxin system VapC family toxin [Gemmatimonadota bacterium]